jgi:hypothetical protein
MTKWTQDALDAPHTQRELDAIPQGVTPAQAAQWMNEAADDATQYLRDRIEQLERELVAEKALTDRLHEQLSLWKIRDMVQSVQLGAPTAKHGGCDG